MREGNNPLGKIMPYVDHKILQSEFMISCIIFNLIYFTLIHFHFGQFRIKIKNNENTSEVVKAIAIEHILVVLGLINYYRYFYSNGYHHYMKMMEG